MRKRIFYMIGLCMLLCACGKSSDNNAVTESMTKCENMETNVVAVSEETTENGELHIRFSKKQYEEATALDNGYIRVKENGKYRVIDLNEDWIIPNEYGYIWLMENGDYCFSTQDESVEKRTYGVMNENRDIVLEEEYVSVGIGDDIQEGYFWAKKEDGDWEIYDNKYNMIYRESDEDGIYDFYSFTDDVLVKRKENKQYSTEEEKHYDFLFVNYNVADGTFHNMNNGEFTYMGGEASFIGTTGFRNGYAVLEWQNYSEKNGVLLDTEGNQQNINIKGGTVTLYSSVWPSKGGWVFGTFYGEYGNKVIAYKPMAKISMFLNEYHDGNNGVQVIVLESGSVESNNLVWITNRYGEDTNIIKNLLTGEETTVDFEKLYYEKKNNHMLAKRGEQWGYVDQKFNSLAWYEDASDFIGKYALIKKDDKMYIIDQEFQIVSEPIDGDSGYAMPKAGAFVIRKGELVSIVFVQ